MSTWLYCNFDIRCCNYDKIFFSCGLNRLPYVLCKLQYVKIYLIPPLIGVLGIKFYCRPSVRMYLPPIIFRQLKLCNCLWERFEIWYIASVLLAVSSMRLIWMPHVNSLFTGLKLNTLCQILVS